MMRSVLLCAALAAVPLSGCVSDQTTRQPDSALPTPAADRTAEAVAIGLRAQAARERGELDRAAELYRQAIEADNELAVLWNDLGIVLLEQENYPGAVDAFGQALALDRNDVRPVFNLAKTYQTIGWAKEANDFYEDALEIAPRHIGATRGLVQTSAVIGRADGTVLDAARNGQLIDSDYRDYYERQITRIEFDMPGGRRTSRPSGG
jgi:Tfp pilus assembly protein PilF